MAALPAIAAPDPTLDALREASARIGNAEPARPYLGMSAIGHPCERWLWYSFRWAVREQFDCDTLWRFEDGHRSEDVMADRLRLVPGVQLRTIDPSTGRQFGAIDLGGHFRGHADGLVTGLLQAPKALHVWEAKAVDRPKFMKLVRAKERVGEKSALKEWGDKYFGDEFYYSQAIMYMAYFDAPRHYLTACTPGGREAISVRTEVDFDEARRLRAKAERIITAAEPPPRLSISPSWHQCKKMFGRECPAYAICHGRKTMPAVNCRTCAHATPELDGNGRWSCALRKRDLTVDEQRAGCDQHRFIPALVPWECTDAHPGDNWIEYRLPDGQLVRNGDPGTGSYSSAELSALIAAPALAGTALDVARAAFDAPLVAARPLTPEEQQQMANPPPPAPARPYRTRGELGQ